MRHRDLSRLTMVIAFFAATLTTFDHVVSLSLGGRAWAETDRREIQARESFAAGRYQDALELFIKLYAEKVHPNYLRNIARCYQNLGQPDKAISSFREYLRQAKSVRPDERAEVEGYIKEMEEELKRKNASAAGSTALPSAGQAAASPAGGEGKTASGTSVTPSTSVTSTLPMAQDPAQTAGGGIALVEASPSPSSTSEGDERPVYKRWWFWTAVAGAVVGGVAIAGAAGAFTKTVDAECLTCR